MYVTSVNQDLSNELIFRVISHRNQKIQHFVNYLKIEKNGRSADQNKFLIDNSTKLQLIIFS